MINQQITQIIFRCDASTTIGSGHVIRCLTLAKALTKKGSICMFVCKKAEGDLIEQIKTQGHLVHVLPALTTPEQDWQHTTAFVKTLKHSPDWLIVDHYGLDVKWEDKLRHNANKLMVIDDLANREHVCDLLLDQNMVHDMAHRYKGLLHGKCVELLGPKYALLRPEFAAEKKRIIKRTFPPRHVLITFGGTDHENMALLSLKALNYMGYPGQVTLVAGQNNQNTAELELMCSKRPNTTFMQSTDKMAEIMRKADIAIGAAGMTTWERMCLGLPCVTIAVNENQVEMAEFLGSNHYSFYAGTSASLTSQKLATYLENVFFDSKKFRGIEKYAVDHVDGNGATDIADILLDKDSILLK